ncbi:MAG: TetR/AcrR family transcriptional regulator [Mycolicibacterium cosmeticum]|nr:TetR/AcrR family transcriptional regulator [Mycolicibacterium cosmeticum]
MSKTSVRQRIVATAIALFEEKGYDAVTVEEIARRADVGRTTLFRHFGSKEHLVFPDHDALLADAEAKLTAATHRTAFATVIGCARMVFAHYLSEGEIAQARYRLTSTVPELRDREVASISQYTRLFTRHLLAHQPGGANAALEAEILAATVVTAHNYVLRRWLRAETITPVDDFSRAMDTATGMLQTTSQKRTAIIVLETEESLDALLPRIEQIAKGSAR